MSIEGLPSSFYESFPESRRPAIIDGFSAARKDIAKLISSFSDKLSVRAVPVRFDRQGNPHVEISHYSEFDNTIRMDERKDDAEYVITLRHEIGHFIDAKTKHSSGLRKFKSAIQADMDSLNKSNINDMLNDVGFSNVIYSRYVSDILSALTNNDPRIVSYYYSYGMPFYGHDVLYWSGAKGPYKAVQKEVFANLFAIYAENNSNIVAFADKWFPNMVCQFNNIAGKK